MHLLRHATIPLLATKGQEGTMLGMCVIPAPVDVTNTIRLAVRAVLKAISEARQRLLEVLGDMALCVEALEGVPPP